MTFARRSLPVLAVLFGCVGCDQAIKSVAQSYLPPAQVWSFAGDSVRLQLAHNTGAFLSLGASLTPEMRNVLFTLGVGCLLAVLLAYTLLAKGLNPAGRLGMALVVGGGLSNLADRWFHGGYVVDFLNLGIGSLRTGIFNLADVAICAGVALLLLKQKPIPSPAPRAPDA